MANLVEVVFTTDSSGQQWNTCVWDPRAGTSLMTYKNGTAAPHTMCLLGNDYLISAEPGKSIIRAWALNKHEQTQLRMVCPGPIHALATSPDGLYLAAGISEALYVWQTATGYLLSTVKAHYQAITCVKFTDDGSFLITGSEDCQVLVWDLLNLISKTSLGDTNIISEATPKYSFNHHTLPVLDLFIGKGGIRAMLATVSMDQSCKIYDLSSGNLLVNLIFPVGLTSVTMNVINSEVFVGASSGIIYSYYLHNAPRTPDFHIPPDSPSMFKGHDNAVTCLSASIDSTLLLSGSLDEKVIIWDIQSRQMLRTLSHKGAITNAFFQITPKNVFSEDLKASIVLKNLLRHAGNEESKEIDVISHGSHGIPHPTEMQKQWNHTLELLEQGEVPPMFHSEGDDDAANEVKRLKAINQGLYKFALEELLKPRETEDTPVLPEAERAPSLTPNASAKKRKRPKLMKN